MGLLITVEGGEYTGKTSVVLPTIKQYFEQKNVPVLVSREPGGTPEGEKIREEIFEKVKNNADSNELALLFNKARRIHLDNVIIPFLGAHKEKKSVVVLDRYLDSTRVYQGMQYGVPQETLTQLEKEYVQGFLPDITFILYFPEPVFEQTLIDRQKNDREQTAWDMENNEKHLIRQRYYLQLPALAKKMGENRIFIPLDASGSKESIEKNIKDYLDQHVNGDVLNS